ncbi:PIN domain-containing protein [Nocardia sp. R7R-8]|uniref:PIN domain-containing protein n=1 Tax=Nocardia sp. R7R-8 TaxID=3459304 RepID=UPI00403E121E
MSPSCQVRRARITEPSSDAHLSAVTVAELRFGMAAMPPGKRRDNLRDRFETRVLPLFAGRVLAFDVTASAVYAELMAAARAIGGAIGTADGYIAATAGAARMAVATRDTAPFTAAGVPVIDPWA